MEADIPEVTDLDSGRSLRYVDGQSRPLDVRRWYRNWVLFFGSVTGWVTYSIMATSGLGGVGRGARQGGAGSAAFLASAFA